VRLSSVSVFVNSTTRLKTMCSSRLLRLGLCLILGILTEPYCFVVQADSSVPPVSDVVTENFESGTLDVWKKISSDDLSLARGEGWLESTGLSVAVGQHESYLYQTRVAHAEEGYLSFWFNPNGVSIPDQGISWIPSQSIRVADVKGPEWWHVLVALRVHKPAGQGYKAYLEWRADDGSYYDYELGEFDLFDGWQKITLGFRVDDWVAVWLDGALKRRVTGITHQEALGEVVEVGKTNASSSISPAGVLRYDEVAFQMPRIQDLWVDATSGDDANDGRTAATAFRTIQRAADLAGSGTTVHVLPGIYREVVRPAMSGRAMEAVTYSAHNGPGTAIIRGSEPASSLSWTQLGANTIGLPPGVDPANVYYADLSTWELDGSPRFVVELDHNGEVVARLPLAREPDWQVVTDWKYHEFWWVADGGSGVAGCDPTTDSDLDCDFAWRSMTELTDRTDDIDPAGVEPGNLTTVGDLAGATLVAMDTRQGHYVYRRTIVAHDVTAGRVTVDPPCEHDLGSGDPGLGWGSKYYVEDKPYLLDTPGEWWYDTDSNRLYLWPRTPGNPATMSIEISRWDDGFQLGNRSYVTLDGLTLEFFNERAIYQLGSEGSKSYNNIVRNAIIRYANRGVSVQQIADGSAGNITAGFTLENSEIAYMDTYAILSHYWWEDESIPDSSKHSGIVNTVIRGNEMHHLGFRSDSGSAVGASFQRADKLRFEGNHVHHVAHNGVQFSMSIIQSEREYGFSPEDIKTGEILIKDNIFEKACQLTTDCAALKFWGDPPDSHVFRDVLLTGNVLKDTFGWTYVSEKRGRWMGGTGSEVRGMGGSGLYVDMASGIHAYRNIAYNNACAGFKFAGVWRDGDIVFYNNVAANSLYGFSLGGGSFDTHGSVNTQLLNNIIVNNEGYGIVQVDADGIYDHIDIDHNLYYNNGWRAYDDGGLWNPGAMVIYRGSAPNEYYLTLAGIQANTAWESHGMEGDPPFRDYDPADHNLHDGSWPDWHLTAASGNAIDRGTIVLPHPLRALLDASGVDNLYWGNAFDIGAFEYEYGFVLNVDSFAKAIDPGGVAIYDVNVESAGGFTATVDLVTASPSPSLTVSLLPTSITPPGQAVLAITDTHTGPSLPGQWYTVPITGTGGGFKRIASVKLLVGGARGYLPLVMSNE
jgi:hypothetical protein